MATLSRPAGPSLRGKALLVVHHSLCASQGLCSVTSRGSCNGNVGSDEV
jgi:hypothetical protein